jgi:nitroreductase
MEDLLRSLQWRYSVQKFDESRKIPGDVWSTLEQALVLSPSSFGLQLWKFFVVTNQTVKDELRAASWNQAHVSQASHVVVLAARKDPNVADAERYLNRIAEVRGVPLATLEKLRNILTGFMQKPPARIDLNVWAEKQVYIALGTFMTSAAVLGVDTCPMEGFDPSKVDALLGLTEQGYSSAVIALAGYRAADDKFASHPKVRFKTDDVITRIV